MKIPVFIISITLINVISCLSLGSNFDSFYLNASTSLNVASFNIQVFGVSKMSKPDVVEILLKILDRYDMTFIQEIRDSSNTAFPDLVRVIYEN